MFTAIDKFIVAALGLAVVLGLIDDETAQTVGGIATAVLVYLVPNK